MPQNWYAYWPLENGKTATASDAMDVSQIVLSGVDLNPEQQLVRKRQQAISTLGNLILLNLSVNRSVQHSAFLNKRDGLITHTSLRLNVPLIAKNEWDEGEIMARGEMLGHAALNVWSKGD